MQVGKDSPNPHISSLACVLLGELLRLSNFLPVDLCTRLHALPTLVNPAGVFNQPMNRSHAARVVCVCACVSVAVLAFPDTSTVVCC